MVKIVLYHPHVDMHDGVLCYCAMYRLTEKVNGVEDGEAEITPTEGATDAEILDAIKQAAVDHANLQTGNAAAFTTADVITWEARP